MFGLSPADTMIWPDVLKMLGCLLDDLRDGVVPTSTPRVASKYSPYRQRKPFDRSMLEKSLSGVL